MRAWEFVATNEPLRLVEREDPVARGNEVVVDLKAAGLCHTDVSALEDPGWMHLFGDLPVVFGHECAGQISAVGDEVQGFKVGDRVGIHSHTDAGEIIGFHRDGAYATKLKVPTETLVPLPDAAGYELGAIATDAGRTSHQAVRMGDVKPGMRVGIIGIGGLGQLAARIAVVRGCEVFAVDRDAAARELAWTLGVKDVVADVAELGAFECEVIIDFAGFGETTSEALKALGGEHGKIVVVGMGKLESQISTYDLIMKQATIVGSHGGTRQDIEDMYELFASGDVDPVYSTTTFEKIPEGLDRLKRGEVKGRLVARIE